MKLTSAGFEKICQTLRNLGHNNEVMKKFFGELRVLNIDQKSSMRISLPQVYTGFDSSSKLCVKETPTIMLHKKVFHNGDGTEEIYWE